MWRRASAQPHTAHCYSNFLFLMTLSSGRPTCVFTEFGISHAIAFVVYTRLELHENFTFCILWARKLSRVSFCMCVWVRERSKLIVCIVQMRFALNFIYSIRKPHHMYNAYIGRVGLAYRIKTFRSIFLTISYKNRSIIISWFICYFEMQMESIRMRVLCIYSYSFLLATMAHDFVHRFRNKPSCLYSRRQLSP